MRLVEESYRVSEAFPRHERFGLDQQIAASGRVNPIEHR